MLDFSKMNVAGNDFVVLDTQGLAPLDWPQVARMICRRRFAVGADGLMVLEKNCGQQWFARMYNPDGSQDVCGNGMLCSAVHLKNKGLTDKNEFTLLSADGPKDVRLTCDDSSKISAAINMGCARYEPKDIPALIEGERMFAFPVNIDGESIRIYALTTGTPHAVIYCESLPLDEYFFKFAPMIEFLPVFPEQITVSWACVENTNKINTRIWERGGVGESLACGTGACAVAALSHTIGVTGKKVAIAAPGGEYVVEIDDNEEVHLSAIPELAFTGRICISTKSTV